jgi:hypothetical protein
VTKTHTFHSRQSTPLRYIDLLKTSLSNKTARNVETTLFESELNSTFLRSRALSERDRTTERTSESGILHLNDTNITCTTHRSRADHPSWHLDLDGEICGRSKGKTADSSSWHVHRHCSVRKCSWVSSPRCGVDGCCEWTGTILVDLSSMSVVVKMRPNRPSTHLMQSHVECTIGVTGWEARGSTRTSSSCDTVLNCTSCRFRSSRGCSARAGTSRSASRFTPKEVGKETTLGCVAGGSSCSSRTHES